MLSRLLFLILLAPWALYAQQPTATIDVLKYEFEVGLSDSNDMVQGHARIHFKAIGSFKTLYLDLTSKGSDGKGMTVQSVSENGPLSFTHSRDSLRIQFKSTITAGSEKTIDVYYAGIPRDGLIIGKNRYERRGFSADHWPNRARNWLPCVDLCARRIIKKNRI